jgi:hypothetical protein
MAEPRKDLSMEDAEKLASEAIKNDAAEIVLEKQENGQWTLTVKEAGGSSAK